MKSTDPRPPLQQPTGSYRWVLAPDANGLDGLLAINGAPYFVVPIRTGKQRLVKDRAVIGYRLLKGDGTTHDVFPGPLHWECSCGDFVFNRDRAPTPQLRECKHCFFLRHALPVVDLPWPVPAPVEPHDPLPDAPGSDGDHFAFS